MKIYNLAVLAISFLVDMVSLTILVVLACACVTIDAKGLQLACMKIRKGFTAGFKHHIQPIVLPPGLPDGFEMIVPECPGDTGTGGVDVMACDDESIPNVKFTEPSSVSVYRTDSKNTYIVVTITLYCKTPQDHPVKIPQYLVKELYFV